MTRLDWDKHRRLERLRKATPKPVRRRRKENLPPEQLKRALAWWRELQATAPGKTEHPVRTEKAQGPKPTSTPAARANAGRPLRTLSVVDLESRVDSGWSDEGILSAVSSELGFRSTRRAGALREKVERRIASLRRTKKSTIDLSTLDDISLGELEQLYIEHLMRKHSDVGTVARILGIERSALLRRIERAAPPRG